MNDIFAKLTVATALCTPSFTAIAAQPTRAATVFWDLEFFDSPSGEQIGTGGFSYDDSEPFEGTIPSPVPYIPEFPDITIRKSDNWYALESFSATIAGVTWNLTSLREVPQCRETELGD
ncbi:MAG: hypothetical protein IGR93_16960, partial [Hydrococcus sp. C42_A2020_068]|nr:hypothetical protein [Hydrococcus sp. C42_A2020_068]